MEGTSGATWGRLASVRRTLAWATLAAEQGRKARYVGANCVRLLDEVLGEADLPEEIAAGAVAARAALADADTLEGAAQVEAFLTAGAALEAVLPLSQAGAGLALGVPLEARARLVVPADPGAESPKGASPEVPQTTRPERRPEERRRPDERRPDERRPDERRPDERRPDERRPEAADRRAPRSETTPPRDLPVEPEPRIVEPPDHRLPLGHPEGTGAPLSEIPGLSPALVEALAAAGLGSAADLLLTSPVGFERPVLLALEDPAVVGATGIVRGRISTRAIRYFPGRRATEIGLATAQQQRVLCRWWGAAPRRVARLQAGAELAVVGEVRATERGFLVEDGEAVGVDGRGSGWLPQYAVERVEDKDLRELIAAALGSTLGAVKDPLPDEMLQAHRLLALDEALRDAHFPANASGRGRARMAFEELLLVQLALSRQVGRAPVERGVVSKALHGHVGQLQVQFDLTLNDDQELAFSQIRRDLLRPTPMTRVLEGDVGTNKGLVALLAAVVVVENRSQVAFISADPAAAERQYLFAEGMLRAIGIKPLYVADAISHAAADALRRGEASVVFGTPGLVTGEAEWRRLGLVVVMEQRGYGTLLPAQLDAKAPRPGLLVVSAAPIPPLLLLSAYGTFDVSTLRRAEPLKVSTRVFASTEQRAAYESVHEWVSAGRQALVMFPVGVGQDLLGREDAERVVKALKADLLPDARLGAYASDMSREERGRVFEDFRHRRLDVLVCTTPIEDGPPVPSCTVVVVEHADRWDLIRLHRVRGQAGHGSVPGHCLFVLSDAPSPEGVRNVERAATDGGRLELLDEDLDAPGGPRLAPALRGLEPPALVWAEMPRDRELLLQTRTLAFQMLREDVALKRYPAIRRLVAERWGDLLAEPERGGSSSTTSEDAARGRKRRRRRRRR